MNRKLIITALLSCVSGLLAGYVASSELNTTSPAMPGFINEFDLILRELCRQQGSAARFTISPTPGRPDVVVRETDGESDTSLSYGPGRTITVRGMKGQLRLSQRDRDTFLILGYAAAWIANHSQDPTFESWLKQSLDAADSNYLNPDKHGAVIRHDNDVVEIIMIN